MVSDLRLAIRGELQTFIDGQIELIERGAMTAARNMENRGKRALRGDVLRAGLGPRLAKTWRGEVFPSRAISMRPTVQFKTKAPVLINAFERGVTIRSENGNWLAIPTPDFISSISKLKRSQNRKKLITLAESIYGRLRFVPVRGRKLGLLVTDNAQKSRGKRGGYRVASDARRRKGTAESFVVFFLVPEARLKKRLNYPAIERGLIRDWPDFMARGISQHLDKAA